MRGTLFDVVRLLAAVALIFAVVFGLPMAVQMALFAFVVVGLVIHLAALWRRSDCRRGHDWQQLPGDAPGSTFRVCSRCGETGYLVPKEIS